MLRALYRRAGAGSFGWVALALLAASVARAEPPAAVKSPENAAAGATAPAAQTSSRRALAAGASVIPGVFVHGTGHYVLGQPRTAKRLLLAEGVGAGMALGGAATIFFTGASRYFIGPAAAVTGIGVGLLVTSFAADVYGTLSPDAGAAGRRVTAPPFFESEVGYRHVYDPQFSYRNFVVESLSIRVDRFRVTPSGWFSTAGDSARYRVEGAYRLAGALPRRAPADLSSFDIVVAGTHHRNDPSGFVVWSGEVAAHGRYDLAKVGPTLRGAFVEGDLGYAHQLYVYDVAGVKVPSDDAMMLLLRFGFGAVLRGRAGAGSEVLAYYDHRRDGYAAGFLTPGIGSAIAGYFGATGRWYFNRSVGVAVDVQVGSAVVGGASLLLRQW
jgi:hypothetical protein